MAQDSESCPLCNTPGPRPYYRDTLREYLYCGKCRLVFVPGQYWLNYDREKAVYDLHENNAADQGYRKFLSRLAAPLSERLPLNQKGLDFGCGPGPVLSVLMEEQGHSMSNFDPIYFNDTALLSRTYDFITATEAVEHFQHPSEVFDLLFKMLHPGGWLGIMTKMVIDRQAFRNWHYIRDLTHISFYSQFTFQYLAERFASPVYFIGNDVILFQKKPG
ncbi:MAG: class I SAM-dependent methyltransferase [Desulfobacterales bacterium]|nr:class I SAM-dependent methyltransferase [Desulfobacterales bacterium]